MTRIIKEMTYKNQQIMPTLLNFLGPTMNFIPLATYPKNSIIVIIKDSDKEFQIKYLVLKVGKPEEYLKFQIDNVEFNKYYIIDSNAHNFEEMKNNLEALGQDYVKTHQMGYRMS